MRRTPISWTVVSIMPPTLSRSSLGDRWAGHDHFQPAFLFEPAKIPPEGVRIAIILLWNSSNVMIRPGSLYRVAPL